MQEISAAFHLESFTEESDGKDNDCRKGDQGKGFVLQQEGYDHVYFLSGMG